MSRLAEIDLERQETLAEAQCNWAEAYREYCAMMDKWPPAHRKPEEAKEIEQAFFRVEYAAMRLEAAKRNRYQV